MWTLFPRLPKYLVVAEFEVYNSRIIDKETNHSLVLFTGLLEDCETYVEELGKVRKSGVGIRPTSNFCEIELRLGNK